MPCSSYNGEYDGGVLAKCFQKMMRMTCYVKTVICDLLIRDSMFGQYLYLISENMNECDTAGSG